MLRRVMQHVAPLADGHQVRVGVVCGVVIPVRRREYNPRGPHGSEHIVSPDGEARDLPPPIAPGSRLSIPPPAVAKMQTVWPCGRRQASQRPCARRKRITAESCGQSMG